MPISQPDEDTEMTTDNIDIAAIDLRARKLRAAFIRSLFSRRVR